MNPTPPLLFGPYGKPALNQAAAWRDAGANALWFHGFDDDAFAACQKHGLAPCVEFKTFRGDFTRHPELIPVGANGKPIRFGPLVQGVCLSQADFIDEMRQSLRDGLRRLAPAGIWLDYLTYAGWFETPNPDLQEHCFCRGCVATFCAMTGIDATTPAEILGKHSQAWHEHRCRRIADFARELAATIRAHRPSCVVGLYLCPWAPEDFNGALTAIFGQDCRLLAEAIDVFTPLIYAHTCGRPATWGRQYLEQSQRWIPAERKVQLILDAEDFPETLSTAAEAANPSWGIQLFGGAGIVKDPRAATTFRRAVEQIQAKVAT